MRKWLGIGSLIFLLLFSTGCGLWQTERSLTGVVEDQDIGVPLEGVSVNLDNFFTTTDSSGAYSFKNLPNGDYTVRAVKTGYHNRELEVAITGEELLNFTLEATEKGSVSGKVVDEQDGSEIENAMVAIGTKETITDAEGDFLLEGIPVGERELNIQVNGYAEQNKTVMVEEDKETEIEAKMISTENGGVQGVLTDGKTGNPVGGAEISVDDETVVTAADGSFIITGLLSGNWDIKAEKAGYAQTEEAIVIEPGMIISKDLHLTPNIVSGKVIDKFGQYALGGVIVKIEGVAETTTSAAGTFQLHPVPMGEHIIEFSRANYSALMRVFELQDHVIDLGDIELTSNQMGAITGITHMGEVPVPWVRVYAFKDGELKGVGQSNQDGVYTLFDLPKGAYEIGLHKDGYKAAGDFEGNLVMVSPGEMRTYDIELEEVAIDVPLSGYVTDTRGGPPLAGAEVFIPGGDPVVTDISGYFEFTTIPTSPFDLLVTKEGLAGVKVQDIYIEYSLHLEIPTRNVFNPDWSTVPPTIEVNGVTPNEEVFGELEIDITVTGDQFLGPFVFYVYFGGMQRFPVEGETFIEKNQATVSINTEKHPDGPSFIRILAYDDNENSTQKIIPVTVINDQVAAALPGEIPVMNALSVTMGQTFGYYSQKRDKLFDERDLTGDPGIIQLRHGDELNLEELDPGATLFARILWAPAPGADGYAVYRGEKHLGNIAGTRYDDFSLNHESFNSTVEYTLIPYNDYGYGPAKTRVVPVLEPFNVMLESPGNEATGVDLSPTFEWDITNSFPPGTELLFSVHLFEGTWWKIWELDVFDVFSIVYPDVLEPALVYSWDVFYADAFLLWEYDTTGYSYGLSIAGDGLGSFNGEFIFTTMDEVQ